ncbi:cation efflux family protein [Streptococcus parauberis KCTC 11537]|nr:cation efflux family protein [Streptococcus parauberis]AEF25757.1 cation efflux family protein [Streptococcus parauberis KCTC 11537]
MLQAEIKANFVDGIISYGIGLTLLMLYFIAIDGKLGFLHYTGDFFITIMLVAISFKEPLMVLIHSFKEFAYSTVQDQEIKASIISVFKAELPNHLENLDITIYKQGMQINVRVFIIGIDNTDTIEELALEKANLLNHLRKEFEQISLEFTF